MVQVDHLTLLRQKGKFARVCLNIDISKPLPSTLKIPTPIRQLIIPLIYEGLHEVCALCGSNSHSLDQCPSVPSIPKIEVVVEKFQTHGLAENSPSHNVSTSSPLETKDKWIRVAPKKRGRPVPSTKAREGSSGGLKIIEPILDQARPSNASRPITSPLVKDKGKAVLIEQDTMAKEPVPNGPFVEGIPLAPLGHVSALIVSACLTPKLLPTTTLMSPFSSTTLNATQALSPVPPLTVSPLSLMRTPTVLNC